MVEKKIKNNVLWHVEIHKTQISVSTNKILLEHSQAHLFLDCLWLLSCYIHRVEQLQQRLHGKNIYYLTLYGKSWLTLALVDYPEGAEYLLWSKMASVFLFVCFNVFIYFWVRDRAQTGGAERQRDTESQAGSGLWAVSTEPDVGPEPTNHEIMTWTEVGHLTNWGTQVPPNWFCFNLSSSTYYLSENEW